MLVSDEDHRSATGASQGEKPAPFEFGIIYLAFGRPFLAMAVNSFLSLRASNPNTGACIVTNMLEQAPAIPGWDESTDHWIHVRSDDKENRFYKTAIHDLSPFAKTVYLDCDTVVLDDISPLSFYLDFFEVGARPGKSPGPVPDRNKRLFNGTKRFADLPHWNGGVIAFRKGPAAAEFFDNWNRSYRELGFKRDQPALIEAMFRSRCRIFPLEPRWNNSDSLNSDGLLDRSESRDRIAVWHYKWDIDRRLADDIVCSARIAFREDVSDIRTFLRQRSPALSPRHPRNVAKYFLRRVRGRLSDRLNQKKTAAARLPVRSPTC